MAAIRIGNCTLGTRPRIAAIVDRPIDIDTVEHAMKTGADLLEIRADLFRGEFVDTMEYIRMVRKELSPPMIGTMRETPRNAQKREELFKQLLMVVDAVDIEIDTPIASEVISMAAASDRVVIVSEHDYDETPDTKGLQRIVDRATEMGADIVKIATMAQCPDDVRRLLRFTSESVAPLVSIAMGPVGTISRLTGPLFGSLFTFAFLGDREVAPGQIPFGRLVEEIRRYYPE
jgi:3-dehydroquinate dehydratase-1